MKVALCYSGAIRTLPDLLDNHIDFLIKKYDCDVFLETWDVYGYGGHKLKYEWDEIDIIPQNIVDLILDKLNPVYYNFENYRKKETEFSEFENSYYYGHPYCTNILSMFYKIKQCHLALDNHNKEYDIVLRLRPDLEFNKSVEFQFPQKNTLYVNKNGAWNSQIIVDQFFYGSKEVMDLVCNTYDKLHDMFSKGLALKAAEYLLYLSVMEENINLESQDMTFYKIKRSIGQEYH